VLTGRFAAWDESKLRQWLLDQGIVAPKGPKEQLVQSAKSVIPLPPLPIARVPLPLLPQLFMVTSTGKQASPLHPPRLPLLLSPLKQLIPL